MRLSSSIFCLLQVATVLAVPVNNQLSDGINKNLDAGNRELAAVQDAQSAIKNNAPKAQVQQAEAEVQSALNEAVGDRTANQNTAAASGASAAVQSGLAKVANAQAGAQSNINKLTGTNSDSETLNQLQSTFTKGFATNENNLKLVSSFSVSHNCCGKHHTNPCI
jgi:regulator of protease activity HflC (stomatin/prohibitin superfamily)